MQEAARAEGWRPARMVAAAAGFFLLWRGLFGGLGCAVPLLAGAWAVRRALGTRRASGTWSASVKGRPPSHDTNVVEAKSPAELEGPTASASPEPTKAPE